MQTPDKHIVAWDEAYSLCKTLADKARKPNIILSVANGGMIPAAIVARLLKVYKVYHIGLSSYDEKKTQSRLKLYHEPDLIKEQTFQNILVVDDILDTGNTFRYISKYLDNKHFKQVQFAALHHKQKRLQYVPSNFVSAIECKEQTWIEYPWE